MVTAASEPVTTLGTAAVVAGAVVAGAVVGTGVLEIDVEDEDEEELEDLLEEVLELELELDVSPPRIELRRLGADDEADDDADCGKNESATL